MTERGMAFGPPMVLALLAGRKTQTRRGLSIRGFPDFTEFGVSDTEGYDWHFRDKEMRWQDFRNDELLKLLPVQVGDTLWVREAWRTYKDFDQIKPSDLPHCPPSPIFYEVDRDNCDRHGKYRYARFMCRWMSRKLLEVTDVRIERLQSISEADAIAEGLFFSEPTQEDRDWAKACAEEDGGSEDIRGVWTIPGTDCGFGPKPRVPIWGPTPETAYRFLWESINGRETWELNPWIIAYTFKEIKDENAKN